MLIMTRYIVFLTFSLYSIILSACTPQAEILATATPTDVQVPTETIIWFPATATPTQLPVAEQSPTPDPHPGLGAQLLSDDFSTASFWPTNQSESSAAIISNGRITLSTSLSGNVVLSTRTEPAFGDFYAEITASPGLCDGEDEYGFIIRSASLGDQYRFGLSCDGRAKVDRILGAEASRPLGWIASPVIPSIMPSNVRLAVWGSGSELRFFVDDVFLFSLENAVIFEGGLGVYVRARGQGGLSVSFSDLQVWALDN